METQTVSHSDQSHAKDHNIDVCMHLSTSFDFRRWERSRTPTVVHVPHHAPVSGLHLLSESGLLSTSLFYGIVARSMPFIGKVHKGFIGTADRPNGLGLGNPNAEFAPDVSACAIVSDGGRARILWGFRSGEIAIVSASGLLNPTIRPSTDIVRSVVTEQHEQEVKDVVWTPDRTMCATASADGTLKVWNTTVGRLQLHCIWTSPKKPSLVPTSMPFVRLPLMRRTAS
jgi:hypothetical protein